MNSSQRTAAAWTVALLFVGSTGGLALWRREQRLQRFETEVCRQLVANQQLVSRLRALRSTTHAPEIKEAEAKRTLPPGQPPAAMPTTDRASLLQQIMKDMPEQRAWERSWWQRSVMTEFGGWLDSLNVSPARLTDIKAALLDFVIQRQESLRSLIESKLPEGGKEYRAAYLKAENERQQKLKQVLMPEEIVSFEASRTAENWSRCIPEVQLFLADRGVPALTADQRRQLTLAAAEVKEQPSGGTVSKRVTEHQRLERVAQAATTLLPEPQREAFAAYVQFARERAKVSGELLYPTDPDRVSLSVPTY